MSSTVIHAAARFRCHHLYAAADRTAHFMFACLRCGHRIECLALEQQPRSTEVLAFPWRRQQTAADAEAVIAETPVDRLWGAR